MTGARDHEEQLEYLRMHYTELARRHGDSPKAVQYSDQESHWNRFRVLADIGIKSVAKVVDLGCGTGEFLRFMRAERDFAGEYVGIDISDEQLSIARSKFSDARFVKRNVLRDGLGTDADVVVINGVFNNRIPDTDGFEYMKDILRSTMPSVKYGISFNAMSSFVDYFDEGLCYYDPGEVFSFCKKELSHLVSLRHDYYVKLGVIPFEFSIYVFANRVEASRKSRS